MNFWQLLLLSFIFLVVGAISIIIIGLIAAKKDKTPQYKNAVSNAVIDLYDNHILTMITENGETYIQKNKVSLQKDAGTEDFSNPLSREILQYGFKGKNRTTLTDFNDQLLANREDLIETAKNMASSLVKTDNPNKRMSISHQDNTTISLVVLIPSLEQPGDLYDLNLHSGYSNPLGYTFSPGYVGDYSNYRSSGSTSSDYDSTGSTYDYND